MKNYFANRYHFTPEQVDKMTVQEVSGFMALEHAREEKQERKRLEEEAKSRIRKGNGRRNH